MTTDQTLVNQIERDLLDNTPLADLLRKCLLLGGRSGSQELREWARHELRGYKGDDDLPKYRVVAAPIMMDAIGGAYSVTGKIVPATSLPKFARDADLGNDVELRHGVGELEAMLVGRSPDEGIHLMFPGADLIGRWIDQKSGNPYQHTHNIYWSMLPSTIQGAIDNIRTTLTELIVELMAAVPAGQDVPTAEQATQAWNVAVSGGESHFHIAAPVTTLQASGGSTIQDVAGGPTGIAGNDLTQTTTDNGSQVQAIRAWLNEYRVSVAELEEGVRPVAMQQLDQVAAEIEKDEPHPAIVNGLLGSLRSFAQNGIAAAGAGAGTMGLAQLVAHWPL